MLWGIDPFSYNFWGTTIANEKYQKFESVVFCLRVFPWRLWAGFGMNRRRFPFTHWPRDCSSVKWEPCLGIPYSTPILTRDSFKQWWNLACYVTPNPWNFSIRMVMQPFTRFLANNLILVRSVLYNLKSPFHGVWGGLAKYVKTSCTVSSLRRNLPFQFVSRFLPWLTSRSFLPKQTSLRP